MRNISDWYPPSKYLFYPLYKFYRKQCGLNMYVSNFSTWASSAVLHAVLFASNGNYINGVKYGGIFIGLGVVSTGVKFLKRKNKKDNKTLEDLVEV